LLWGNALNGYNAAVIRTEHEAITAEEAIEKLRKQMPVPIREGAGAAVE
jgi:adenine deaminase